MQKCVICGGSLSAFKTLYDDRFGYPGNFTIVSCGDCGHKSLDARFSAEELGELYTEYYPRSLYSIDDYRPHCEVSSFRSWLDGAKSFAFRWVPPHVRILDIGCGFGETLGYHKARGCEVYGVEADENIRRVAEKFGYNIHVGLFDPSLYGPEFFDYVTMDQVVEHMTDPLRTLRDINGILKPGGYLVIGAPNGDGWGAWLFGTRWVSWHIPYHLQFFSSKSMALAASESGYELESVRTVTSSDYLHLQWNHMAFRPKRGEKSQFWVPQPDVTRFRKMVFKLLGFVHRMKFNHLMTRFFDALGIGDNYLFVLRKR
ncbi:MAG: class I SAM-dependent methyltransferase [Geobacteraceae bacterium]|jgi:SAM-dependent methyltransferase